MPEDNEKLMRDVAEEVLQQYGLEPVDLTKTPTAIGDVLEEIAPRGEETKLREFVGKKITVRSVQPFEGQYGIGAFILFNDEGGALYNTVIGQQVVMRKLFQVKNHLPIVATVTEVEGGKFGKYFDLV